MRLKHLHCDEFGKPSKGLPLQRVKILGIREAQMLSTVEEKEFA